MTQLQAVQQRYLQDKLPIRLGGLAANLARISSFAVVSANRSAVSSLLEESKWFIEWTVPDAPLETQAVLVELQIQLAVWSHTWAEEKEKKDFKDLLVSEAKKWSDRVLNLSGLLSQ